MKTQLGLFARRGFGFFAFGELLIDSDTRLPAVIPTRDAAETYLKANTPAWLATYARVVPVTVQEAEGRSTYIIGEGPERECPSSVRTLPGRPSTIHTYPREAPVTICAPKGSTCAACHGCGTVCNQCFLDGARCKCP